VLRPFAVIITIGLLAQPADAEDGKVESPKWLLSWGKKGDAPGEFFSPITIVIDKNDEILVSDNNNGRLQRFDTEGKYIGGFDLPRDNPKRKTSMIGGMVLDGEGHIYLSFMSQHKVGVFTYDGKLVREWGKKGAGPGEFDQPGGMVFGPDGTLYVCDQCNHRIQRFTPDGRLLAQWGEHGSGPGQFGGPEEKGSRFAGPHFITLDSKGRLYTTEGCAARVQQFSLEGKPLGAWGNKTQEPGGFGAKKFTYAPNPFGPIGVFVDPQDRVWVSSLNDRVQAFTPEGKYLFGIAGTGEGPGQLARPHGMAMDSKGNLYVCDAGNQRIQKFAIPRP
jgi:sugar lactone lactonase YvrE